MNPMQTISAFCVPDQGRRKSQRQKGHFTVLLSPQKLETDILLGGVSSNKIAKSQSVLQQIGLF